MRNSGRPCYSFPKLMAGFCQSPPHWAVPYSQERISYVKHDHLRAETLSVSSGQGDSAQTGHHYWALTHPFCQQSWLAPVWVVRKTENSDPSPKGLKLLSPALQTSLPQLFLYLHKHFHVWMRLEDFWDETSGNPDLTWPTKQEEGVQSNWLGRQCTLPEIPDASSFENKEIIIFLIKFRWARRNESKLKTPSWRRGR